MSNYRALSKEISNQIIFDKENNIKNPYAFKDENIVRRYKNHDEAKLWRPAFVMDVEKILHNNFYNRYSDKTQVISFNRNDDISRRALHVQLVSRTARTIGMALGLNLDLIEAISLGHDIGHTPFGHMGELYLNNSYNKNTGRLFNHNVHSVRVLDKLIQRNISLQVLDGVLCHNGEMEQQCYKPVDYLDFDIFDNNIEECYTDKEANKRQCPSTLEGCVMRVSDIIAYLGKDRQDAIKIGLIPDEPIFSSSSLGSTNAEIINNMTVSIIENSYGKPYISMDKEIYDAFSRAKKENYERIYKNDSVESQIEICVAPMFEKMYDKLLEDIKKGAEDSYIFKHHINYLASANAHTHYEETSFIDNYLKNDANDIVVDYIASMTDDYFVDLYKQLFPTEHIDITYKGYFD